MKSGVRAQALLDRLTTRMRGPLQRAYEKAQTAMVDKVSMSRLEALLARGDTSGALALLLDAGQVSSKSILRTQFSAVLEAGAAETLKAGANRIVGDHFVRITAGSPRAAEAMERMTSQFFPPIYQDTRKVLTQAWSDGLAAGKSPLAVARSTRQFIGLTDYDYSIMQSYQLDLRAGNYAATLDRSLRDARYDSMLRKADDAGRSLTEGEVTTLTDRYNERLVAWRSETWTRSASLNAARESQLVAWQDAADAAGLDSTETMKTWVTTMDGKERPEHADANGITVQLDDEFPVDGGVMTPGDGVYNCRCTFTVSVVPSSQSAQDKFFSDASKLFQ